MRNGVGTGLKRWHFLDALMPGLLTLYILLGVQSVPFHGDEAMQITMSRDYYTAFVHRQPAALLVSPPYTIDSEPWLRLINGSVNRFAEGLSLHLSGYDESHLPSLWQWPLSYEDNVAQGNRPPAPILYSSRLPSALFLAASSSIMFAIGWTFGGRLTAYLASLIYTLNPIILLNGRRAMMEGSLLCFGLLTILLAIHISRGRQDWRWWLALSLSAALTLASKHSGIVFVASAFSWLILAALFDHLKENRTLRLPYPLFLKTGAGLLFTFSLFTLFSPALWNNPLDRFRDLLSERQQLLEAQVQAEPTAPTSLTDRLTGILTQSFISQPVYYEAAFWGNSAEIRAEIIKYEASSLAGIMPSPILGFILTLFAGIGLLSLIQVRQSWQWGLVCWLLITTASLLINPLPWQRYYLPLIPVMALCAAFGFSQLTNRWLQRRSST